MPRGHDGAYDYHRTMLDDVIRMDAYEAAIRELVKPGDVVLDVGTGTGILAMLAAKRGARVHAVESMGIATMAERLIAANGLNDRITLHRADLVEMEPVEPVDLVISEFMGRFVVDDDMLDAVRASGRWMKPDARFCPGALRLMLAPVADIQLPPVDLWMQDMYGLDLGPGKGPALEWCYAVHAPEGALVSEGVEYARMRPPGDRIAWDAELSFTATRAGLVRGFVGWWEAELSDEVSLCTSPGNTTHWGQYLFPVAPTQVSVGDPLRMRLGLAGDIWHWSGQVGEHVFRHSSMQHLGGATLWPDPPADPKALSNEGSKALAEGRLDEAEAKLQAAVRALTPEHDDIAGVLYENLGLVFFNQGRDRPAARAFLRALDGDPLRREQSLRMLVTSLVRMGFGGEAHRYLAVYEQRYGAHPYIRGSNA